MSPEERLWFQGAADKPWRLRNDRGAIEILSQSDIEAIRRNLAQCGALDRVLEPRFVLTDKHDDSRLGRNSRRITEG